MLKHLEASASLAGCEEGVCNTWGFPIYRTAYGGETDRLWETLL